MTEITIVIRERDNYKDEEAKHKTKGEFFIEHIGDRVFVRIED